MFGGRDGEIASLYQETLRATKAKDLLLKRLKQMDSERVALKREAETIRSQGQRSRFEENSCIRSPGCLAACG